MLLQAHRQPPLESHDTDDENVEIMEPKNIYNFFWVSKAAWSHQKTAQGLQRGEQKLMSNAMSRQKKSIFRVSMMIAGLNDVANAHRPPKSHRPFCYVFFFFGPDMIS